MTAPEKPKASGTALQAGWDALARGDWEGAKAAFATAVAEGETAEAVEGLGWAAWWLNDEEGAFAGRERAYAMYREAGDARGAARMATWLGTDHMDFRGELAVAQGWLGRARRLLDGVEESPEHGWLWVHEAEKRLITGDFPGALELATRAAGLGERLGLIDLQMVALAHEGLARVAEGDVAGAIPRLDESAAAAFAGEFREAWSVGWAVCCVIQACEQVRDYGRAAEWCRKLGDWSERMDITYLNRTCRAHYAGVLIWKGTWDEAEQELTEAADRLAETRPPMAAEAVVRLGELRRRQGRLDEAAEIFRGEPEHPQALLGLGEVCLDSGDAAGARDRAEEYLRAAPEHAVVLRAPGLELLARASAALGDERSATEAARELAELAEIVVTEPLRAAAAFAAGAAAHASGDRRGARTAFEDAARLYQRASAPFEAARARIELARVLAADGRPTDAVREARAAATSLRRVGAAAEADRAEELEPEIERLAARGDGTLTRREREVLALVAKGRSDREIAEALVISEHTVHRHVSNILRKLDCSSRSAAVAEALARGEI